jgi:hypothetical protein
MVDYTDKELMMFLDAYSYHDYHYQDYNCQGYRYQSKTLEFFKKDIVSDTGGIFYEVCNIPYEELPLYINDYVMDMWYKDCVSIRLRIGR